jgi:hypothetical protein
MVESVGSKKWSKAVRSWVVEFQTRDRREYLPAFDSLFKDSLPEIKERDGAKLPS